MDHVDQRCVRLKALWEVQLSPARCARPTGARYPAAAMAVPFPRVLLVLLMPSGITAIASAFAASPPGGRASAKRTRRQRRGAHTARRACGAQVTYHAELGLDPAHFRPARAPAESDGDAAGCSGHGGGGSGAGAGGGGGRVTYGRTVVIECGGRAAAEVLEVVLP
jgi:hypothetical protein